MEMATIQYKFYANIAVISTNSRFKILKEVLAWFKKAYDRVTLL